MQTSRWIRISALTLLVGLGAVACDDGTSPAADFDAQQAAQTVESLTAAVETESLEDAFGSVQNAGMIFSSTSMQLLAEPPHELDVAAMETQGDVSADVIPSEYYGTTYAWNPDSLSYVATDATGAPANGVRILWYAIDPSTGLPAEPLNALGYVDLADESTTESNRLAVTIFRYADEVTLADYSFDLSFTYTQSSFTFNVASMGYLSNGTDQLNFDLSQNLSATETEVTIDQSFALDLEGTDRAMSFDATVTADPQSETGEPETMVAETTISNGERTIRMEIAYQNDALDGTIYDNGTPVVLISGTLENPVFTDTEGNELTQQQIDALQALWDAIGEMFELVERLFGFATP